jgi:Ca2+-binding RTX toxin-like protein
MVGQAGDDLYLVDDAADEAIEAAGEGTDEVRTAISFTLGANVENLTGTGSTGQTLTGNGGDNRIVGGTGDDVLNGGTGNDFLFGHIGADVVAGGLGDDVYLIDAADTIVEHFGEGTDEVRTVGTIFVLGAGLDNLRGLNDGGHDFRGNAGPNAIIGAGGNDILRMQDGGDDLAFGKGGVDGFYFGAAFDQYDLADGGDNRDSLILQGNYSLTLRFAPTGGSSIVNVESISLVSGANASFGDTANRRYSYDLTMIDANVAPGALMKVNGANLLAGEDFTLDASDEKDAPLQIFGGLGLDRLTGGQQGDAFVFGEGRFAAGDSVTGGGGYDVLYLRGDYVIDFNAAGFAGALAGVESIALLTSANTEFLAGGDGDFDYTITWNDAMLGAGGTMTANGGRLQAHETFVFNGASESDGHLRVFGGAGGDTLTTGGGNDQIHGGAGADVLTGGAGADLYRYFSAGDSTASATDTIKGFVSGQDRIDLTHIDAVAATEANDGFTFIGSAPFTAAGQLRAVNVAADVWQIEGDTNGDGIADFVIRLEQTPLVAAADFML